MSTLRICCFVALAGCRRDPTPGDDTDIPDTDIPDTDVPDTSDDTGTVDDTGPDTVVDPATVELDGPCPMATDHGGFGVFADPLLTTVSGGVADAVQPLTVLEAVGTAGGCTLLRRDNPFCDPGCGPNEICAPGGECVAYPLQQDVGIVTVDGLLEDVEMEPGIPGNSYYALGLPHPAWEPGALVTLRASGAAFAPFVLYGVGVEPLALEPGEWALDETQDLEIRWNVPAPDVRSQIHLRVTIDQHGTTPVQLACDFPDVGVGTVPASIVADFVGFGVTGFPSGKLTRRTVDAIPFGDGCIDLEVGWSETAELRVVGYTPCNDPEDCPYGQTCNTALEICE